MVKTRRWTKYNTFGTRLRKCRESKGWSRRELSNASGVSQSSIDQYEYDYTNPSLFVTADLAKALGTSIDYLVFGKE